MRILFPYPLEFSLFPDLYEYVTILREYGFDAYYAGTTSREDGMLNKTRLPFVFHTSSYSRKGFLHFVRRTISLLSPDIVHVFHYRGSGLLPILSKRYDRKWIIDVRTVQVENRRHTTDLFFPVKDRVTWLETQVYNHILALTPWISQKLKPSLRPISLVPLGASWEKLNPENRISVRKKTRRELGILADSPMILYTGSLSPSRQISKVVLAFAEVLSKFPDASLVVIGGERRVPQTSDQFLQRLLQLADRLGIAEKASFLGWMQYPEIAPYYAAADIGISYTPLGTPYQHQPPTKLIEYMAAGMIAVSNRTPATEDLIKDGVNGILCGEDIEQISVGMCRALDCLKKDHRECLAQMTSQAQESVRARDWHVIVRDYVIPVYEQLLGENR